MMDDVVGNVFDDNGKLKGEITLKECYKCYMDMLKLIYHDYMITVIDGDFETFKKLQISTTDKMINVIHSRYADHVEGIRMSVFKAKKMDDPRSTSIDG